MSEDGTFETLAMNVGFRGQTGSDGNIAKPTRMTLCENVKSRKGQRICFSDAAAPQFSMLLTLPERAFEGIPFSAVCSALRFYTAKTLSGHSFCWACP
jgi:hypothetical protein